MKNQIEEYMKATKKINDSLPYLNEMLSENTKTASQVEIAINTLGTSPHMADILNGNNTDNNDLLVCTYAHNYYNSDTDNITRIERLLDMKAHPDNIHTYKNDFSTFNEQSELLNKYFFNNKKNNEQNNNKLAKYMDQFNDFCFDLNIDNVLNGSIEFKLK